MSTREWSLSVILLKLLYIVCVLEVGIGSIHSDVLSVFLCHTYIFMTVGPSCYT